MTHSRPKIAGETAAFWDRPINLHNSSNDEVDRLCAALRSGTSPGSLVVSGRVGFQECERQRPRFGGGCRIVARSRIAKETVVSVGKLHVDEALLSSPQGFHCLMNLVGADMLIAASPET